MLLPLRHFSVEKSEWSPYVHSSDEDTILLVMAVRQHGEPLLQDH